MSDIGVAESSRRAISCNCNICPDGYEGNCPFSDLIDNSYITEDNLCSCISACDWESIIEDEGI